MRRIAPLVILLALAAVPAVAAQAESAALAAEQPEGQLCEVATPDLGLEIFQDPSPQTHIGRECGSCVEFGSGTCDGASTCQQACECQCDHQFDQCSANCTSPSCWFNCEQQALNCYDCCSLL